MDVFHRAWVWVVSFGLVLGLVGVLPTPGSQADVKSDGFKKIFKKIFPPCGIGTRDKRFVVTSKYPGEVCDNKSGLRWQQTPSPDFFVWGREWGSPNAIDHCANLDLNGKKWRLATVEEYITLLNFNVFTQAEALNEPNGPFIGVLPGFFWSATSYIGPADGWFVNFATGFVLSNSKDFHLHAWCVRPAKNSKVY